MQTLWLRAIIIISIKNCFLKCKRQELGICVQILIELSYNSFPNFLFLIFYILSLDVLRNGVFGYLACLWNISDRALSIYIKK